MMRKKKAAVKASKKNTRERGSRERRLDRRFEKKKGKLTSKKNDANRALLRRARANSVAVILS